MSFKVNIEMKVSKQILDALSPYRANVGILNGLKEIGHTLKMTSRAGIRKRNKTGRIYNFRGRKHRAGAVGEYPAKRTGDLGRSIDYKITGKKLHFGTDIHYAKYLQQYKTPEQRSSSWRKVGPRPFLTLAHDEHVGNFKVIMSKHMRKELGI